MREQGALFEGGQAAALREVGVQGCGGNAQLVQQQAQQVAATAGPREHHHASAQYPKVLQLIHATVCSRN